MSVQYSYPHNAYAHCPRQHHAMTWTPKTPLWIRTSAEVTVDAGSPHLIGLRTIDNGQASAITPVLRTRHGFVATRGASIRVSPHMHTTQADIERFAHALKQAT